MQSTLPMLIYGGLGPCEQIPGVFWTKYKCFRYKNTLAKDILLTAFVDINAKISWAVER